MATWRVGLLLFLCLFAMACGKIVDIPDRVLVTVDGGDGDAGLAQETSALSALTPSRGTLSPAFSPSTVSYTLQANDPLGIHPFTVTATAASPNATITIAGKSVASGAASAPIPLSSTKPTPIDIAVSSAAGTQRYTIVVTSVPPYTYVKASTAGANAFGQSIAIDGDTLVVGAPAEASAAAGVNGEQNDTSAPSAGAVYVFTRAGDTWAQQAYLKAQKARAGSQFGWSVAISGDTLVAGARSEASGARGVNGDQTDISTPYAGAAYVFTRSGTTWSQQAYLKATNTRAYSWFGRSVAIDRDVIAVGAPGESSLATGIDHDQSDGGEPDAGAVYVFRRLGTYWSPEAYVKASNTPFQKVSLSHTSAQFGTSVALSGNTLAVGASGESSGATGIGGDQTNTKAEGSGAVFVFTSTGTTWTQQAYVKASNRTGGFGFSLALSHDALAVGANEDPGGGAAYVFSRVGVTWAQEAYVKASNARSDSWFGMSVALDGDALAVGAIGETSNARGINGDQSNTSAASAGATYVFLRSSGAWTQRTYVKAPNTRPNNRFGFGLALKNGMLAVGSVPEPSGATGINGNQDDTSVPGAGAVYLVQ
jgi:hypothetical protein